jgi:hypothetical protein
MAFWLANSMDPVFLGDSFLIKFMEGFMPDCLRPGKYLVMNPAVPECTFTGDGEYHDIRPYPMTIGSMQAALISHAVKRLPFGLAVRSNSYCAALAGYQYQKSTINFTYSGSGPVASIAINGRPLVHTLQIPLTLLPAGQVCVDVVMGGLVRDPFRLVASSVQLDNIEITGAAARYGITGYGNNMFCFEGKLTNIELLDHAHCAIKFDTARHDGFTYVLFRGKGEYSLFVT